MSKNNTKKCAYNFDSKLPPCVILRVHKYSYLSDFISDKRSRVNDLAIALKIECIEFKGDYIDIKNENCINCMFCVLGCPGNNIEVRNNFYLEALCSNFKIDYNDKLDGDVLDNLFSGKFIKLPSIRLQQFKIKYKSFEDFTSKDETTNISVWGANTLKYLSASANPRIGLEVGMKITSRDRGGRLDICMFNNNYLFVAEAKISFDKMMNEGRFESQLIAYEEELKSATENTEIKYFKFLLIGGPESDLLPFSHIDCTSKVGNRAITFYNTVIKNNFFFISSNALLSLSLLKLFRGDLYSFESIKNKIFSKDVIGLLSCGIIVNENGSIRIIPLPKYLYKENDDTNLSLAAEPDL